MRVKKMICLVAALVAANVHAQPETNAVRELTLHECVDLALEHNLDVQIQKYLPIIDRYAIEEAYGAYDISFNSSIKRNYSKSAGGISSSTGLQSSPNEFTDDIYTVGFGGPGGGNGLTPWGMTYGLNASVDRTGVDSIATNGVPFSRPDQYKSFTGFTVDQPLLRNFFIDSARETILVNKATLKYDQYGVRLQMINTVAAVEQAYYDLVFDIENVKVQQTAVELAERLVAENKRRVEIGSLAPLDEKQAESQASSSRADLINAQSVLGTQEDLLKSLITDDFATWGRVRITPADKLLAVPEKFDLQDSWSKGVTQRPELLQLKTDLERRNIVLKFQKNQLLPQLDLVGSYGRTGLKSQFDSSVSDIRDNEFPSYSYGVIFSLPLSNKTTRNRYKETKAGIEQALLGYKKQEETVLVQIKDAIGQARSNFERIKATRDARQYAEAALDAEQKKLASGKSTSFNVLQLQRDLTARSSEEIRALADYNKSLSQLSQNEGSTLDRRNLKIEIK